MNFDQLPSEKPTGGFVVPEGRYLAVINDPKMAQPKDTTKAKFLNFKLDLYDNQNNKVGTIFDSLFESDKSLTKYKIGRFILALGLAIKEFELSDLAKLINGKKLLVDVKTEKKENQPERSIVDAVSKEIYYPVSEAETVKGDAGNTSDAPINAEDGFPKSINDVDEVY